MPGLPFHVAGGSFTPTSQPLQLFTSLLNKAPPISTPKPQSSRRRKLWEISHKFHCSIIGTCFDTTALRGFMKKVMHLPAHTNDFVLHTSAVGACESRGQLSELLQKQLEKRFQSSIRRFSAAKDRTALQSMWQEATTSGYEIPGALWATWSHPACDKTLEQSVYGDIHMIQHQIGTGTRADLNTLKTLQDENRELYRQLDKARLENDALRHEKASETHSLGQRIIELRGDLAGRDASYATLHGQLDQLRSKLPDLKDRQNLLRRACDAEARNHTLTAQAAHHESELRQLRQLYTTLIAEQQQAQDDSPSALEPGENCEPENLSGAPLKTPATTAG